MQHLVLVEDIFQGSALASSKGLVAAIIAGIITRVHVEWSVNPDDELAHDRHQLPRPSQKLSDTAFGIQDRKVAGKIRGSMLVPLEELGQPLITHCNMYEPGEHPCISCQRL